MCLALQHHTFLMEEPAADLRGLSKKELIFVGTFINISGKHPVIDIDQQGKSQHIKYSQTKKRERQADQSHNHQKLIEAVVAITPPHKTL